ncbi:MAG: hypothetical protein ACM31L_13280 [Actinomycetota bacterium]
MRIAAILLTLLLFCGCAGPAPDPSRFSPISPTSVTTVDGQGVVVMGLSLIHPPMRDGLLTGWRALPVDLTWIAYSPATRQRIGRTTLTASHDGTGCDQAGHCPTRPLLWVVPAGRYLLASAEVGPVDVKKAHNIANFDHVATTSGTNQFGSFVLHDFSGAIAPSGDVPTFSVAAGEVVYVGDLRLDFGRGKSFAWSLGRDDAAARQFLTGSPLGERMTVRPGTRLDQLEGAGGR